MNIYCFIGGTNSLGCHVSALAANGHGLGGHMSSNEGWAKSDIGIESESKHDIYRRYYPKHKLIWVETDQRETHAGLQEAVKNNKTFEYKAERNLRYNDTGISIELFDQLHPNKIEVNGKFLRKPLIGLPLPQNNAELKYLSKHYFGKELTCSRLSSGFYECGVPVKEYRDIIFENALGTSYDVEKTFWVTILGDLGTGGIGHYSYQGVTTRNDEDRKRLRKWVNSPGAKMRVTFKRNVDELFN